MDRITNLVREVETRGLNLAESRDDWVRMAFAFAELGEAGRELFHRIARQSTKYDRKANDRQFNDALRTRGRAARPVTLATFVQRCRDFGISVERPAAPRYRVPLYQPVHPTQIQTMLEPKPCHFLQYLHHILPEEQAAAAERMYRLEARSDGGVVYWLIDREGRYHDGKVMYYHPDGHRDKSQERHPRWIAHIVPGQGEAAQIADCQARAAIRPLFGEHLLNESPDSPVAIVEAEKTAIIASQRFASQGFVWLAAGGESMLRVESFQSLRGRRIILFPDTDPDGATFRHWSHIAQEASTRYGIQIYVSPLLERHATPEQKEQKVDIADYLTPERGKGKG